VSNNVHHIMTYNVSTGTCALHL